MADDAKKRRAGTQAASFRSEVDLYEPVKALLEGQGYEVKGEVRDCDVVAVREPGEPPGDRRAEARRHPAAPAPGARIGAQSIFSSTAIARVGSR